MSAPFPGEENHQDKGSFRREGVIIRQFLYPDDYRSAVDLWKNGGSGVHLSPSDALDEIKKKMDRDPDLFLVAEDEGRLVGTVIGGFDGRRGMVYHLVVDPGYRTAGLGSRLMDELEKCLRAKGCIRCYLLVTPENEYAMDFYRKRGWERMTVVPFAKNL